MKKIYFFLMALVISTIHAQDGTVDTSFNSQDNIGYDYTMAVNSTGVYIAAFNNSTTQPRVQKVDHTGALTSFNLPGSFSSYDGQNFIFDIELQSDGQLLIGGKFSYMGRYSLIRVDALGNIDPNFNPQLPQNFSVRDIVIQPQQAK